VIGAAAFWQALAAGATVEAGVIIATIGKPRHIRAALALGSGFATVVLIGWMPIIWLGVLLGLGRWPA